MEPEKKSNGALVGLIIIIIILVLGGAYIWLSSKKNVDNKNVQPESESVSATDSTELNTLDQEIDVADIDVGANVINSVQ